MVEIKGPNVSVTGGVSLRPHGEIVSEEGIKTSDRPAPHGVMEIQTEASLTGVPVLGCVSGPFMLDEAWGAKLFCTRCHWFEIYTSFTAATHDFPTKCKSEHREDDCPVERWRKNLPRKAKR